MERIESLPRTRELRDGAPHGPVEELRQRLGPHLSDEEFLLRATMPAAQVDAMLAAGPARASLRSGHETCHESHPPADRARAISRTSRCEKPGFQPGAAAYARPPERRSKYERGGRAEVASRARCRPIKGFMFDLDGTLLLSDRSLGGYEVLPGAVEVLTTSEGARRSPLSC